DDHVTLRPEGTAGVVRAAIQHRLYAGQLPVKLWYSGSFFRYERPQAGRYRHFSQVGAEALGVDDPALDAEVIALAVRAYADLGVSCEEAPRLVRGLDYYTRTTFEFQHDGLGAQTAIGGGGRYDGLSEDVGGPAMPGVGWALGVDRTVLALRAEGVELPAE